MKLFEFECVAPGDHMLGHTDECVKEIRRAVYATTCKNHSGGPASPHTVDCFWYYTAVIEAERDAALRIGGDDD